ncbi:MAG: hypothetical protein K0S61_548 [Anaerocolumna sp.]|jgi:tRNA A-37 threonylcarbamoyl transferase component Bud32|nr:hypothetical protein [Anaerocolumna sp.]
MDQKIRLHQYYFIDRSIATELFIPFDKSISIDTIIPIHNGMSTSNYCVVSGKRKYLLKIYSGNTGGIEPIMYEYLKNNINIPSLLFYNNSKTACPYSYAIIEFIEGENLLEYIKSNHTYPLDKVHKISEMLSVIHENKYIKSGLLDKQLQIVNPMKNTMNLIKDSLSGKAGFNLPSACREQTLLYIERNSELFNRIDSDFVLCHGDFGYGNILINHEKVYFIDFEYTLAESKYRDIGKFFRNKETEVQRFINKETYNTFAKGYCSIGNILPEDWIHLAKLADIPVMLGLLNRDNPPIAWIADIEHDIMSAIR